MREVSHWDDAPSDTSDEGPIGNTETWLSGAVDAVRLGVSRYEVPAGKAASPQHAEDEEVFYVLSGSGWSLEDDRCHAIGPGDVVYYAAYDPAHTVVAGDDGLSFIAFGTGDPPRGVVRFPRIGKVKVFEHLLEGDRTHQWKLEARLPRIEVKDDPDPRPATIVNVADVEPMFTRGATEGRAFLRPMGARGIALNEARIGPGEEAAPPHCHSMEEELFVVLEGSGVVVIGDDEHPVRAGSVVGRPPATGVAHHFRAGDDGLRLLMFSDKHANDMCFYPRTREVRIRGLGVQFTV
ncbi:MAG: cupin domain-containing protein [Solirubrobacteraceae bacterium]